MHDVTLCPCNPFALKPNQHETRGCLGREERGAVIRETVDHTTRCTEKRTQHDTRQDRTRKGTAAVQGRSPKIGIRKEPLEF